MWRTVLIPWQCAGVSRELYEGQSGVGSWRFLLLVWNKHIKMGLRLYPIYFTSSLGRLRQKCIMVKLIPTFFFWGGGKFGNFFCCYKRVPPFVYSWSWPKSGTCAAGFRVTKTEIIARPGQFKGGLNPTTYDVILYSSSHFMQEVHYVICTAYLCMKVKNVVKSTKRNVVFLNKSWHI